ncbi:MAG: hypothetical protein PHO23_02855 [Candidatus Pacebacteria bacterium]|nr:hypothetical protein [Candidatus Paceibacterota bacterium]
MFFNSSSYSITNNNTLILFDSANREVDKICYTDNELLLQNCLPNILPFQSYERKSVITDTFLSMKNKGDSQYGGNSNNLGNNNLDFIIRDYADPQNIKYVEPMVK